MADTSPMTTRLAVESDMAAVMELEQRTANAAHWGEAQYKQIFQAEPRRVMLLVEDANLLRGFVVASAVAAEWEIENVAVDEAFRRQGLGRVLMESLIAKARAEQAESIFLEVRESNGSARSLYEKAGFMQSGRRTAYFRNPTEDAVLYRLGF
jgi:ribosomal-protein-alanine N-acetyltransferase